MSFMKIVFSFEREQVLNNFIAHQNYSYNPIIILTNQANHNLILSNAEVFLRVKQKIKP